MAKIDRAVLELREMDELAAGGSVIHGLHPLAKLITTMVYIFVTASFHKYDLNGLSVLVLFPVLLFQLSGIPVRTCFVKLKLVLPLVCAVGLFNPFLDRTPMLRLGGFLITGGMLSMVTLMLKGVFCLMASFLLAATTSIDAICAALRRLHVPSMLVTLLLLTYRYVTVIMDEVSIMTTAYCLRAPGQNGIHYKAWGSFLGQLLLRSMDRAGELFSGMQLRGFQGEFRYAEPARMKGTDVAYTIFCTLAFVLCRFTNPAAMLGNLMLRFM